MRIYTEEERLQLMIADRRALHRIPEFGYDLPKTRAYVRGALEEMQPDELSDCADGFKVVFRAKRAERGAIAFRADMDALKSEENTGVDFRSEHPGMCHACGHDGHMAALLMLARIIAGKRDCLDRDVVLIFQPAEENQGGARYMIEAGVLENPAVTEVYGLHIMPTLPVGTIGCRPGPLMASTDTVEINITGRTAHGATPHMGNDAIMALAHFVLNVQSALKRRVNAMDPTVFTVGCVQSGQVHNIISGHAHLKGSLRSYDAQVREEMLRVIRDTMAASDLLYNTKSELTIVKSYPAVVNDVDCVSRLAACAGEGYRTIDPVTISEDFSEFELHVPGAYFFCGCADEAHTELLHSDKFNFDERALLKGVEVFEKLIGFGGAQ